MVECSYPNIDYLVNNHNIVLLEDSSNFVFKVDFQDDCLVYKSLIKKNKSIIKTILKTLDKSLTNYFINKYDSSFMDHIAKTSVEECIAREYVTLQEWKHRGIPCMPVLEHQDGVIVYPYLDSINFHNLLKTKTALCSEYNQLLTLVDTIRTAAKSENNPLLLHPDLLPKNFLYLNKTNTTIAIDPGFVLKNLPLAELDAKINIQFLYDLMTYNAGKDYAREFLNTLNREEKNLIKEYLTPLSNDILTYFRIRTNLRNMVMGIDAVNWREKFSHKNTAEINELIDDSL